MSGLPKRKPELLTPTIDIMFGIRTQEMASTPRSAKSLFLPALPLLERLAEKFEGQCKVLKINVDKNPMISNNQGVQGLPTFMTFVKGDEYERKVGSQTDGQLTDMIERSIAEFVKVRGENPDSETLTNLVWMEFHKSTAQDGMRYSFISNSCIVASLCKARFLEGNNYEN